MADAKVIPFDDDRSRGSAQRMSRRRSAPRRAGDPVAGVASLPGQQEGPQQDGPPSGEPRVAPGAPAGQVSEPRSGGGWDRRIAGGLAFLRRRLTGEYEVDDFGYDEELTDQVLMSLLRPFYEKYFRVEVKGIENIPADGGALIVANHSGTLPLDGLMMQVAVHDNHPQGRHLRLLAADLVFMLPVINELARKAGHTLACAEDAERLLGRGELVGVMPEGFKGIGKPFSERYKLQRFGRGGFVSTALRTGSPIVPCSIVGAEEIYPMIGNAKTVARVLGIPYFPITPTFPWLGPLGAVPLP
ncbi:lysophospholipid acyltransferase family protein, partial [Streptomyces sp. NPDC093510]|uniref:lysophospholipid acyltransferase family protein n=1 Tax=Streptomyces sp. NPDC093510 TaxID=3155199 RepID=UPI00342A004D